MSGLALIGLRRILAVVLVAVSIVLSWGLGVMSTVEGYIVFDPYIDTWFAPGYRPELEQRVRVGQTRAEVEAILGAPLYGTVPVHWRPGVYAAAYTNDGGHDLRLGIDHRHPRHKDLAWHYYCIAYDSVEVVCAIYSGWAYD